MKLAVAASALLMTTGAWHPVVGSSDPNPRIDAAVATTVKNVHQLALRVSAEGHPHVYGAIDCKHGTRLDYYGWDFDVQTTGMHRLAVRVPTPATCELTARAVVSGQPVVLSLVLYKR
jgi:hypothetical protein